MLPFQYEFFIKGIIVSVLLGGICGLAGVYIILRGLSYVGHGLSHAAFGGAIVGSIVGLNYYCEWWEKKRGRPSESNMAEGATLWFERWSEAVIRWGWQTGNDTLSGLRASLLARWAGLWQTRIWQAVFDTAEYFLQRWAFAVTLFLLLGMVFVVLLLLDTISVL
jgi:hypothetical protein